MTVIEQPTATTTAVGVDTAGPVVVGYRRDRTGTSALRRAFDEAQLRGVPVRVVHQLVGTEVPELTCPLDRAAQMRATAADSVRSEIAEVVPDLGSVEVFVTTDPIADELVLASRTASLIVLGVTAAHTTMAMIFEAVSRQVAQDAHCPVMLVPEDHHVPDTHTVVCGVDRTSESATALAWAAKDAALRGVTVLAIDVERHFLSHADEPLSNWVRSNVPGTETTVLCSIQVGRPAERLLDETEAHAGLLVVGRHDHRHPHRGRSVASLVSAQTRAPVVIVPPSADNGDHA